MEQSVPHSPRASPALHRSHKYLPSKEAALSPDTTTSWTNNKKKKKRKKGATITQKHHQALYISRCCTRWDPQIAHRGKAVGWGTFPVHFLEVLHFSPFFSLLGTHVTLSYPTVLQHPAG